VQQDLMAELRTRHGPEAWPRPCSTRESAPMAAEPMWHNKTSDRAVHEAWHRLCSARVEPRWDAGLHEARHRLFSAHFAGSRADPAHEIEAGLCTRHAIARARKLGQPSRRGASEQDAGP
jgi:hypothetical protein